MTQERQDELKQMDIEAEALSRALSNKEHESSENIKTRNKSQSPAGSVINKIKEINIESNKHSKESQQISDDSQSSSTSKKQSQSTDKGMSPTDTYEARDPEKFRKEVREKIIELMRQSGYDVSVVEPGEFALKYALSAPYHLFFTRVEKAKETYNQKFSITFPEILDRSLGQIVSSLHLNCMVDVGWLCLQYLLAGQRPNMVILCSQRLGEEELGDNITVVHVEMPFEFGCHHTKVMILQYKDVGIRVVVSTANLYASDWKNRTQGIWISPHLPRLSEAAKWSSGESPTNFKKDLQRYLNSYQNPALKRWRDLVRKADFSAVNVCFIASTPGHFRRIDVNLWGYKKLANVLSQHVMLPPDAPKWSIIAQSSAVGSFGPKYEGWLSKEIVRSMTRETERDLKDYPEFQFIYPSVKNYEQSFDYQDGSSCFLYMKEVHSKQQWIKSYLYQWKAKSGCDQAMPHIKSYTRISPDLKRIAWFVLTSANLSKGAWGVQRGDYYITNYEVGVAFLPKFITGTTTFPITDEDLTAPIFPIPYDFPLCPYDSNDSPFTTHE
ncbi:Probable tyrosyl-DNA phosphodiesterase [Harpegnathos saltator]|uniref:Probable tyrosyl-DNA phosphodiesterase n=1 Tax=Harpegnathos saltator TaxID=610380 RepID=E2B965_HARSA|nr:Probable tyrosyl-DNA phosphodiesterase [Harpegnathos saltator]